MLPLIDEIISMSLTAITQGSPLAIITLFSVVVLTECGIPFPFVLDSILFLTSYQAAQAPTHILLVMLIVFMGRLAGATLIYGLTKLLGNAVIYWFGKRFKYIRRNWDQLTIKLSSQAPMAIALVRLTGLMTMASIISGAMKIRYLYFFLGIVLSSLIFDGSIILLGLITKYGFKLIGFVPSVWHIALALIIVMTVLVLTIRHTARRTLNKKGIVE